MAMVNACVLSTCLAVQVTRSSNSLYSGDGHADRAHAAGHNSVVPFQPATLQQATNIVLLSVRDARGTRVPSDMKSDFVFWV